MTITDSQPQWLLDICEEHTGALHRLSVLLGADAQAEQILCNSLVLLGRRGNRLVDPLERVEFLQEQVVHQARGVRGPAGVLRLPTVSDPRQQEILTAIAGMPIRFSESLVVSHYLSIFGPELAGILRMMVRTSNRRLEEALQRLQQLVGDPAPGSSPGVIESLSQEVTAALRAAGRLVQPPATEELVARLRVLGESERSGVSVWLTSVMLAGSLLIGFWLASLGAQSTPIPASTQSTVSPYPTAVVSRSLPGQLKAVPIYYVGRADGKLYREWRDLPATGDLLKAGIDALLALAPLDPDYVSQWGAGKLNSVELAGSVLTVDLSTEAYRQITAPQAVTEAINQVVYTTSAVIGDPELRVRFTADGGAPPAGFNDPAGYARAGLTPLPLLWLTSPKNGATLPAGPLAIIGTVQANTSTPVVKVLDSSGKEVFSATAQTATAASSDGWRVWSVSLSQTLPKGEYTIQASVEDQAKQTTKEDKVIKIS